LREFIHKNVNRGRNYDFGAELSRHCQRHELQEAPSSAERGARDMSKFSSRTEIFVALANELINCC